MCARLVFCLFSASVKNMKIYLSDLVDGAKFNLVCAEGTVGAVILRCLSRYRLSGGFTIIAFGSNKMKSREQQEQGQDQPKGQVLTTPSDTHPSDILSDYRYRSHTNTRGYKKQKHEIVSPSFLPFANIRFISKWFINKHDFFTI